jgi:hypothetical protein
MERDDYKFIFNIDAAKKFDEKNGEYDDILKNYNLQYSLKMDVETARKVKNNLAMAVIFALKAPYAVAEDRHIGPKVDNPTDWTIHEHFFYTSVKEIWLFDKTTGIIYHRKSA